MVSLLSCSNNNKGANDSASSPVRFDGIYKSDLRTNKANGDQSISYLKFYNDGTVITVSSSGTPEQISKWFEKGHEGVSDGRYTVQQNDISFTSTGNGISVEYSGKIANKELLQLHLKSLSAESDIAYSFVEQ